MKKLMNRLLVFLSKLFSNTPRPSVGSKTQSNRVGKSALGKALQKKRRANKVAKKMRKLNYQKQ